MSRERYIATIADMGAKMKDLEFLNNKLNNYMNNMTVGELLLLQDNVIVKTANENIAAAISNITKSNNN